MSVETWVANTIGKAEVTSPTGIEIFRVAVNGVSKFLTAATLATYIGSGSVVSVALSAPAIFSVSGSPVTISGTLALSLATQSANLIWAGPTTGSAAAPTFRSLVSADIPDISATYATKAGTLAQFAATTSAQLAGVISDETGSGALVFASAPVLIGPNIGAASGTSLALSSNSAFITMGASQDLSVYYDAADTWSQRRGTNAQNLYVYNTYTSGSVYERAILGWSGNNLSIGAQTTGGTLRSTTIYGQTIGFSAAGTVSWNINASGHFVPGSNNAYDLGTTSGPLNLRNGYFAGTVNTANLIASGNVQVTSYISSNAYFHVSSDVGAFFLGAAADAILTRAAAASWQLGYVDTTAATAQTLQVQGIVAGNANTAGADWTLKGSLSTGTGVSGNQIISMGFANLNSNATVTITIASPAVVSWTAHGLVPGSVIRFTTSGTLPTGLALATNYYVISTGLAVNSFRVSATPNGSVVNTSGSQSGTHTATTQTSQQNPASTIATWGPSGLTGSQTTSLLSLQQTWNTSGAPTGVLFNVANVASGSASLLLDLQINSTTVFNIRKDGFLKLSNTGGGNIVDIASSVNSSYVTISPGSGATLFLGSAASLAAGSTNDVCIRGGTIFYISDGGGNRLITATSGSFIFGAADAASAVAQSFSAQSVVAGTSNIAGANWTFKGSIGTGTGAGGQMIFQTAPAGSSSSAQNALATALTLTAPAVNMQPSAVIGNQALATTATDGFLYIPTCAGPPTGVPTTFTGRIPLVYDSTNDFLYFYRSGWKKSIIYA